MVVLIINNCFLSMVQTDHWFLKSKITMSIVSVISWW